MAGDYTINDIYQGGYSSLDPNKSSYGDIFTGYHLPASAIGAPTKPDTANQIAHVNQLLNQGIIPIEVGALKPEIFEQIPKHHFKEINRMAKLSGADISVHAPIVEASGIGEQGYDEGAQWQAEMQLNDVVDKSVELSDKPGMKITIHGAGSIPGADYRMTPEGKKEERLIVVDRETGTIKQVKEEKKFYPSTKDWEKGTILDPRKELKMLNDTEWDNSISQMVHFKEEADRIISANLKKIPKEAIHQIMMDRSKLKYLKGPQREAYDHLRNAQHYLSDSQQNLSGLFNRAYKLGTDKDRELLKKTAEQYKKEMEKAATTGDVHEQSTAISNMISVLEDMKPELYAPIEDYAVEKSSDTFSNVALNAYKKHKNKLPVLSIENMNIGMAFSYGKELKNLILKSKQKFVDKATSEGLMSESEAKQKADQMIGATLDVGHLNLAKKKGFKNKDLLKELKEIEKYVKHVHLHDNFGANDSHLPPGMGNVPTKEILEQLEKAGAKDVKKIVEAGAFVAQFGTSPFPYELESLGASMFTGGVGSEQEPYWNQSIGLYQGYSGGFGMMLPQANYQMFGATFTQLPTELGGSVAGAQGSRMSGKPME